MFKRKHQTVASVMEMFTKTIENLNEIIHYQTVRAGILEEKKAIVQNKIEEADLEIHQARGVADRLNDLLYGEPETNG